MSRFVLVCTESSEAHNDNLDNTSIVHFFLFPLPFLRSTEHFGLKASSSIKQQRRKESHCVAYHGNFGVFRDAAKLNFIKPQLLIFAVFEVFPKTETWITQASFKV